MTVADIRSMMNTKGWFVPMKALSGVTMTLVMALSSGCFDDSKNNGTGRNGLNNTYTDGENDNPTSTTPQNTGNDNFTNTQNRNTTGNNQDLNKGKIPSAENPRLNADRQGAGKSYWEMSCKAAKKAIVATKDNDSDRDGIPNDCEDYLGTSASTYNGYFTSALVIKQDVLAQSIKDEAEQMVADKVIATGSDDKISAVVDEINTGKKFFKGVGRAASGTTRLNQLIALYMALSKIQDGDLRLFKRLYANHYKDKLFLNSSKNPKTRLNFSTDPFNGRQFVSLLTGGYSLGEQLYMNHESGTAIRDIGGIGSTIAGGRDEAAIVVFNEAFLDNPREVSLKIAKLRSKSGQVGMRGALAAYVEGNMELFSSDLGEAVGNIKIDKLDDTGKKEEIIIKAPEKISGSLGRDTGNHFLSVYITEEKEGFIPAQVMALLKDSNDIGDERPELMPQHLAMVCPNNEDHAKKVIAFPLLKYCKGYEKTLQDDCNDNDGDNLDDQLPCDLRKKTSSPQVNSSALPSNKANLAVTNNDVAAADENYYSGEEPEEFNDQ